MQLQGFSWPLRRPMIAAPGNRGGSLLRQVLAILQSGTVLIGTRALAIGSADHS